VRERATTVPSWGRPWRKTDRPLHLPVLPAAIDPNLSKVVVPDERFDHLVASYKPKSVIPAVLTVTDIAGLVKGAAEGAGLGNAFLSHIQAVDGIFHVCRGFAGDEVVHVEGNVDPMRDLDIIHNELRLKDIAIVSAKVEANRKAIENKRGGKEAKEEWEAQVRVLEHLQSGKDVRIGDWGNVDVEAINKLNLVTAKPMIYLVNLSEKDYIRKANKFLPKLAEWLKANHPEDKMIPFSCEFEAKWLEMSATEKEEYSKANSGVKSMMPKIIKAGYHALSLCHFFTAGADEVRAWTLKEGSTYPQAAGVIHTDIQKNFIAAEVFTYDDFKALGSEVKVKEAGKYSTKGKLAEISDGEVVYFKHNS